MATVNLKNVLHLPESRTESYFGNCTKTQFTFQTNSSGIIADSDKATAVGNGDVIRLGVLKAGSKLIDMTAIISDAFTASSTGKIGFQYVDGTDSTDAPQDDDFFCGATSLASASIFRKTATTAPVTLPKDAYLILTNAGAAQSAAGKLDIIVESEQVGA